MRMSRARPAEEIGSFIWEDTVRSWVLVQKKASGSVRSVLDALLSGSESRSSHSSARRRP
jgi:hypothetical protein